MIRSTTHREARRRGAILIVVLALLALFAVIGLGFIYYADSEANAARAYRDAQSRSGNSDAPPDASVALRNFLCALVYDVGDTGTDLLNALRGHSLARSMYGWSGSAGGHVIPFNGIGAFDDTTLPTGVTSRRQLVNFTAINNTVYDPEWTGSTAVAQIGNPLQPGQTRVTTPTARSYVGKNAGYTYPDGNNFFLAALDPRTGEVLTPSFYRP